MKTLLMHYPQATSFSLTGPFQKGYDQNHPYGIYKLDEAMAKKIEENIKNHLFQNLHLRYSNWSNKDKLIHPSYDELIASIQQEVRAHLSLVYSKKLPKDTSPFMCDVFMMKKAKHQQPSDLWHFYHDISLFEDTYQVSLDAARNNSIERDIFDIFQNPYYAPLKPSLLKTNISFFWHCTQSSQLAITYYFSLNQESIAWLNELKGPLDMKELEDFALYHNEELLFSSCTHEGFETDVASQKK